MPTEKIGRVQGAGMYLSTSTSTTSIPKSSVIKKDVEPMTGDTILNANSDLCTIEAIGESNYTVRKQGSTAGPIGKQGYGTYYTAEALPTNAGEEIIILASAVTVPANGRAPMVGDTVESTNAASEGYYGVITEQGSEIRAPEPNKYRIVVQGTRKGPQGAPGGVTRIKGEAESTYRTGEVNLTPENIGAYSPTNPPTMLKGFDTRDDNLAPGQYMSDHNAMSTRAEFKFVSALGLDTIVSDPLCLLYTMVPWLDASGGYPVQMAVTAENGGIAAVRSGLNVDTWSAWSRVYTTNDPPTWDELYGTIPSDKLATQPGNYGINPTPVADSRLYAALERLTVGQMALISTAAKNQLQFYDPAMFTFEVSSDEGVTWTTHEVGVSDIKKLVAGNGEHEPYSLIIPNGKRMRMTIENDNNYVFLNYLHFVTTTRSNGLALAIETKNAATKEWHAIYASENEVAGWPVHVWAQHTHIPWSQVNNASFASTVRITFKPTWNNSDIIEIDDLQWYGTYPFRSRELYAWDEDKNVSFPGNLSDSGGRVYSPGNKPTPEEIGAVAAVSTPPNTRLLYGANADGTQANFTIAAGAAEVSTIPIRTDRGTIVTGTPTENNDAATKAYVDGKVCYDSRMTDIIDGTLEVPRATEAARAVDYADRGGIKTKFDDIETRLTNLGFKEGYILDAAGNATSDKVSRQGNYVIGRFGASIASSTALTRIATLPVGFRPKNDESFNVAGTNIQGGYSAFMITIKTSGEISCIGANGDMFDFIPPTYLNVFSFGFEAPPIT